MPTFVQVIALLVHLPLEAATESVPQTSHSAQLGDPCTEPGDCRVPHSECVQTDNLYWNRQNFCVCQVGYHPSTGFCVADSGGDAMVKLEYSHHQLQEQVTAVTQVTSSTSSTSSSNEETTKNTSARSLLMTPMPPQNLLQGFHFGNRTQNIVSNIVEQLTHLRGQPQTDSMKQRLETLGLPLLLGPKKIGEDSDLDSTTIAPPVSSGDLKAFLLGAVTAVMTYNIEIVNSTVTGTSNSTSSPSPNTTTPLSGSTTTTFSPFVGIANLPTPTRTLPRLNSSTNLNGTTSGGPVTASTMATLATLKSSSANFKDIKDFKEKDFNNSPFLPPALPPFFEKSTKGNPHVGRMTPSTTTTTLIPVLNITILSTTAPPAHAADDPGSRLALMKKVEDLIFRTSTAATVPTTPEPTVVPLAMQPQLPLVPINPFAKPNATQPQPNANPTPSNNSENSSIQASPTSQPPPQSQPQPQPAPTPSLFAPPPKPTPGGIKNLLNNFGIGKILPPQSNSILQPQPQPNPLPTPSSTDSESSSQQVRSTTGDRAPGVDFYAVFRSAAENVIREYLAGSTTMFPPLFGRVPNAKEGATAANGENIEKILEKLVESKGASVAGQSRNQIFLSTRPAFSTPQTTISRTTTPPSVLTSAKVSANPNPTSSGTVTRPKPPFIWKTTSPGQSAHPLPRIVFTG